MKEASAACGGFSYCDKHYRKHRTKIHDDTRADVKIRGVARMSDDFWTARKVVSIAVSIVLVLLLLGVMAGSTKVVPAGHKGVITSSPSGPDTTEINEGWSFDIRYMVCDIELVEYRTQTVNFIGNDEKDDDKGSIAVSSKDNILIYMDFSIIYHISEDKVADLVIENGRDYKSRIIQPIARSVPRDISSRYNAMDIRGERRSEVEYAISVNVTIELAKKYIIVEQFAMRDIRLPLPLEEAIEMKKVAEQNVLTQEYNLEAEQYVANKSVVQMRSQAEAMVINATAFANATVVRALGQAQAIAVVLTALDTPDINNTTRDYLTWAYIQALTDPSCNIKYIVVPSDGGIPLLIDVKDED